MKKYSTLLLAVALITSVIPVAAMESMEASRTQVAANMKQLEIKVAVEKKAEATVEEKQALETSRKLLKATAVLAAAAAAAIYADVDTAAALEMVSEAGQAAYAYAQPTLVEYGLVNAPVAATSLVNYFVNGALATGTLVAVHAGPISTALGF